LVLGGACIDSQCFPKPGYVLTPRSKTPGFVKQNVGGVAANICSVLGQLGNEPTFITAVGTDPAGDMVIQHLQKHGVDTSFIVRSSEYGTAQYVCVMQQDRDLYCAMSDFQIVEQFLEQKNFNTPEFIELLRQSEMVLLDGNLTPKTLNGLLELCQQNDCTVFYEPVGVTKSVSCIRGGKLEGITYISPNELEIEEICRKTNGPSNDEQTLAGFEAQCEWLVSLGCGTVFLTLGARGVYFYTKQQKGLIPAIHIPKNLIRSTSGAGDSFVGGVISGLMESLPLEGSIKRGIEIATKCIKHVETVPRLRESKL